ncbi:MAG: A/G-specific adenine glycosylase [Candidatus Sumerlaeia bacterium]
MAARKQEKASTHTMPSRYLARDFAARLLRWYDIEKRELPWRDIDDPYATLVSEFMLQQTQVATATPYFRRFMKIFPTVQSLATGPEQEVLRAWAGLGYYSRARNLFAAAQKIVRDYGGKVPDQLPDLLFLPGVGPYMAGAIASIAYQIPAPAVDANVIRVLSRLFAMDDNPASPKTRRKLEEIDLVLMDRSRPGDFNQAMMELGSRVCTPTGPLCDQCPVQKHCRALQEGAPEKYPVLPPKPRTVRQTEACAILRLVDRYLIVQRPANRGRYRNMWEFPHVELQGRRKAEDQLRDHMLQAFGMHIEIEEEWAEIQHQVTHHKITKKIYRCKTGAQLPEAEKEQSDYRWATLEEIEQLPLGAPHKKILKLLQESENFFH